MTSDDDTWRGAARLSPAALLTKRQGETVKWLLSKLRMGWASLLHSRRPDARIHDCPLPLRPVHVQGVPLTPSQHRVQFRLPQRPWSSRPCDVLPPGGAVSGLPGSDRRRDDRPFYGVTSAGLACRFFRTDFLATGVPAGAVTLGPPAVCGGAWGSSPGACTHSGPEPRPPIRACSSCSCVTGHGHGRPGQCPREGPKCPLSGQPAAHAPG